MLSFLIENFYPHSLRLQKRASFESWAAPAHLCIVQSQVRRNSSSLSLYPARGWLWGPTIMKQGVWLSHQCLVRQGEERFRKTTERGFCGPWKYPRGLTEKEKERKRTHFFIHSDPLIHPLRWQMVTVPRILHPNQFRVISD